MDEYMLNFLAALVGAFLGSLGTFLTVRLGYKQLFAKTVSANRMDWINVWRENISRFLACAEILINHTCDCKKEHNCDNCKKHYKMIDASELLALIIETSLMLKEKFKAEQIVNILKVNDTAEVISYKHDELECFGAAEDQDETTLYTIIRQAMLDGYIQKDIESYGVLKITATGKQFLKKI